MKVRVGTFAGLLVLLVLSLATIPVSADPISVGDTIRLINGPGSPGGEFGVAMAPGSSVLFVTFCVQRGEFMDYDPAGFTIVGITDHTLEDNVPLAETTAWLYFQFRTGGLAGYAGDATSANALQAAIWVFQGYTLPTGMLDDPNVLALYNLWTANALSAVHGGWENNGQVQVVNLEWATSRSGYEAGDPAQDVLTLVSVPEPGSLALLGIGLLGLGAALRRRTH